MLKDMLQTGSVFFDFQFQQFEKWCIKYGAVGQAIKTKYMKALLYSQSNSEIINVSLFTANASSDTSLFYSSLVENTF